MFRFLIKIFGIIKPKKINFNLIQLLFNTLFATLIKT